MHWYLETCALLAKLLPFSELWREFWFTLLFTILFFTLLFWCFCWWWSKFIRNFMGIIKIYSLLLQSVSTFQNNNSKHEFPFGLYSDSINRTAASLLRISNSVLDLKLITLCVIFFIQLWQLISNWNLPIKRYWTAAIRLCCHWPKTSFTSFKILMIEYDKNVRIK